MSIHTKTAQANISPAIWGLILLLGAIWGGSFFFARIAVAEINPFVLVMERVAIAAAALHLYLLIAGPSFLNARSHFGRFFGLAVLNNVIPFSLIFLGQTQMGAGLASVLNATTPFWTLVLAQYLTADERLSTNKLVGILLGVIGTAIMIGPGVVAGLGGPVWAKLALIGASLSYAFALIYSRRSFAGVAPVHIAAGQLTASSIIMIPIIFLAFSGAPKLVGSTHVTLAVLALAMLSTAFAYILFFRIIAEAGATNASLVTLVVPVSAMLLGIAFLGERLETFEVIGMAMIGFGLIVIDGRLSPLKRR